MKRIANLLCILLAVAVWLFASWPTLLTLHLKWTDVGDSYVLGYPLLIAAGWLIFQRRRQLLAIAPKPSWCGVLFFAASMLLIYAGRLIQLQIVQQIMLPVSLWSVIFALAGWPIARGMLLPIALQYFGMPIWDVLIGALQTMTIVVSHTILGWMQIPIWLQGNRIHLPDGIITVAGSCSGLNLLLAALLIATLQAEMGRYNIYRRFTLFIIAGVIGLVDNWIRVIALILIAHYSHMQSRLIYSHASFGWWIYAVSLVPFFLIAHRLEYPSVARSASFQIKSEATRIPLWQLLVLLATVGICEYGTTVLSVRHGRVQQLQVAGNARVIEPEFMPHYSGYDRQQSWELTGIDGAYELSVFIYAQQYGNKKLIYYKNVIVEESQLESIGKIQVGGHELNFVVVNTAPRRIVWWYYWIDNAVTTNPLRAKLYQLRAALLGDSTAALIVLSQPCTNTDCRIDIERAQDPEHQAVFMQMLSLKGVF